MAFDNSYNNTSPGSAVGNREDLLAMTTLLYPSKAPVTGMLPKSKGTADLAEWTVDTRKDPVNEGVPEGEDVASYESKHNDLTRLQNRMQHNRETFMVSKKQEAYESVTPVNYQQSEEKALVDLMLKVEKAVCSNDGAVTDTGVGTGSKMRGLFKWISDSAQSDGVIDVPADYRTPTSSIHSSGALSESTFNGLLESIYNETGGNDTDFYWVQNTAVRSHVIDQFTRVDASSQIRYPVEGNGVNVYYMVDYFQGPFGMVKMVTANPKCFPDTTNKADSLILNAELLELREALPVGSVENPDLGGGRRGYVDTISTVVCKGPKGLGKTTAIS